ncbi:hypothetical protein [Acinetobacter sp. GSS19]|uniref:hypothetical protein n=1 Tax=Acinetobacter sp. GSS19 TaxID=3020716 RepID=UPI002361AF68|nr:hypothetical protein [Acinetobacter sp. GSS19]
MVFFGGIRTWCLGHPHAILGFALVYVPVLLFSLYISRWSATLKTDKFFFCASMLGGVESPSRWIS